MGKHRVNVGDLYAIPSGQVFGLAKVIFRSLRYKNVILIRLYHERASDPQGLRAPDPKAHSALYYTGIQAAQHGSWIHLGQQVVTVEELSMTKRVSAGEVWIEDTHLGRATEQDMKTLKRMDVYGHVLISEAVTRNTGN